MSSGNDKKKLRKWILAASAAGAGAACLTLPGEDVVFLRFLEVVLVAYIAFLYQVPMKDALMKGIGISGFMTMAGMGVCNVVTICTGGIGILARSVMAGGLVASVGFLSMNRFEKEHSISSKLFNAFTVAGFKYDIRIIWKLVAHHVTAAEISDSQLSRLSPPMREYLKTQADPTVGKAVSSFCGGNVTLPQETYGPMSPILKDTLVSQSANSSALGNIPHSPLFMEYLRLNTPTIMDIPGYQGASVFGEPSLCEAFFDVTQGANRFGVDQCCSLNAVTNLLHRFGKHVDVNDIIGFAMENGLCNKNGETTSNFDVIRILQHFIKCDGAIVNTSAITAEDIIPIFEFKDVDQITDALKAGKQILLQLNADGEDIFNRVNHMVLVTGSAYDKDDNFLGLFVADSGVGESRRFLDKEFLAKHFFHAIGSSLIIVTKT